MAQINHILGVLKALESNEIAVDQNRCVLVRNKNASCLKCAEACTSECISQKDGQLVLETERCIGCGTCTTVCPTGALAAKHPTDRELFEASIAAMQNNGGTVTLACETLLAAAKGRYDAEKVVALTCLGRVDESLIVLLARAGATDVVLAQGACEGCRANPGSAVAERVCATANDLLRTWGREPLARVASKLPASVKRHEAAAFDEGRRAFLADMTATARTAAGAAADLAIRDALSLAEEEPEEVVFQKVQDDGTLPQALPHRRGRLLRGLASLGEPEDIMIGTRLWGHVIIDTDACASCQMCATFCPTGALRKFQEPDGTFGIDHFPSRCVKCRCCADICPEGAISISEEVFAVDLATGAHERYELRPRAVPLGPHQMFDSYKKLLNFDYIYER